MVKMIFTISDLNGGVTEIGLVKMPRYFRFIPKRLILKWIKNHKDEARASLRAGLLKCDIFISDVSFEYEETCIYIRSTMTDLLAIGDKILTIKIF